jgi:3,4-dihydroxy 2-butanone 4-phosphate synthase/GTP cyclohydrolase II
MTGPKAFWPLVDPQTKTDDFARPGHIFPLRAKTGGVLRRTGHTEAAIDLAKLAGYYPAGVLVEILNEDGSMARLPQLIKIAERFDLKVIAIKDLVAYRMRNERLISREISVKLPTRLGEFEVIAYRQLTTGDTHLAIKKGEWKEDEPVLVRVHSSTETGEVIGSLFEGYGAYLNKAIELVANEGKGVLLYMRHSEKQGALLQRLESYQKQLNKGETFSIKSDIEQRDFGVGAQILRDLKVSKMKLLTTQSRRRIGLVGYGLEIVENIQL